MLRNNDDFRWAAPGGSYLGHGICGSTLTRSLARPPSPIKGEGKKEGRLASPFVELCKTDTPSQPSPLAGEGGSAQPSRVRGAAVAVFAKKALSSSFNKRPIKTRLALVLTALLPLAGCGGDPLAQDPFGDAAAECGDDPRIWLPGCATRRNIAALADNPADLDRPRREGARDSMRRDALFSGYNRSSSGDPRGAIQPAQASGGKREP